MTEPLESVDIRHARLGQLPAGQKIGEVAGVFPRIEAQEAIDKMRELEEKVTAEQAALLGKKPEAAEAAPGSRQNRHRRFRQGGPARGPGALRRARERLRQAAAPEGRYRRSASRAPSSPASPKPTRPSRLIEPQSRDRRQSAAAQTEGHRIERHDRGRVGGRTASPCWPASSKTSRWERA